MDIFKYVDEVVELYEKRQEKYAEIAEDLKRMLEDLIIANSEYTLTITSRIKESESVREKLIRNSYYRFHASKDEVIANIQDIIGLRIECKFTEDEKYVYSIFRKMCTHSDDQIYFYNQDFPKIRFKLSEKQPVKQKNGFDIFKIDARYEEKDGDNNIRVNFEVQIKSMVNMFWGEVEHKIIYKNPSYFMVEQQVVENMMSIKENLNLVDHQLHKLYKRYKREDTSKLHYRKENIESILSKLIHDTIAKKMKNDLGFIVQFKDTCDSIVEFIFVVNNAAQMEDYGRVMMDTFYITGNIAKQEISFRAPLALSRELSTGDTFIDTVGFTIQKVFNVDFKWHLYFLILFELERGENTDALETFLRYYKGRLTASADFGKLKEVYGEEEAKKIKEDLMGEMGYVFRRNVDIALFYKEGIQMLSSALKKTICNIVKDVPDWNKEKSIYYLYLNNSVNIEQFN
ncbi:MAG: GTP pyrophosphokinase [Christensenellaceae bacterium]|jgi:ppGpp synthetase/RelA/SpoT-type nucleotidyltranferase